MKGVSGVSLHLWILPPLAVAGSNSGPAPKCRYINLEVYSKSLLYRKNFKSSLFLENPQRKNYLSFEDLQFEVLVFVDTHAMQIHLLKMYHNF